MNFFLSQLEQLTTCRDHEQLDEMTVHALYSVFQPLRVAVYRVVGEASDERWLLTGQCTRSNVDAMESHFEATSAALPLIELPELKQCPWRLQAMQTLDVVNLPLDHGACKLCVSMYVRGSQRAVLELETEHPPEGEVLDGMLHFVSVLSNHHALLEYAERDTLTGLLNRKTFDESFLKASMSARGHVPPSVPDKRVDKQELGHWLGIIDIDHFKSINDRFGHLIGDEVLLQLAQVMRHTFRFQDRLYRFGGEEFLVLLRCDTEHDAQAACARLLNNVKAHAFPRAGQVTVSIGFTEISPGDAPSVAFAKADQAVYYAKEHGRDQVCSYAGLVRTGQAKEQGDSGYVELF